MELRHHLVLLIFIIINQETVRSQEVSSPVTNPTQSTVSNVTQAVTEVASVASTESSSVQSVATKESSSVQSVATTDSSSSTSSAAASPTVVTEQQSEAVNTTENTTAASTSTTLSLNSLVNSSTTIQSETSTESSSVSNSSPVATESSSVINTTEITEKAINDTTAVTVTTEINNVTAEVTNNINDDQNVTTNGDNLKESTTTHSLLVSEEEGFEVLVNVSTEILEITTQGAKDNAFNITIVGDDQSVNNITAVNISSEENIVETNQSDEIDPTTKASESSVVYQLSTIGVPVDENSVVETTTKAETIEVEVSTKNIKENETNESVILQLTTVSVIDEVTTDDTKQIDNELNETNIGREILSESRTEIIESRSFKTMETGPLDIQTQLYIISGVFGAVVFLLILLVLTLALSVAKIKDQLCDSEARYVPGKEQIHGYQNGAFNGGGDVVRGVNERSVDKDNHNDLKDLGYTIYNGKGHSRENVYKVNDPVGGGEQGENIPLDSVSSGRRQMMKYEEGVIPMADEEHGRNYR